MVDGFSCKVVGWKLDRTQASRLATDALESAIAARKASARIGAPLRPWHPVRPRGVRGDPAEARDDSEHEPAGEPARQRQLRELHQDH